MSVEQWVVLALVILLPLLEGVARLRRARVSHDRPGDRLAQAPPSARRGTTPSNRDAGTGAGETSAIPALPPPSNAPGSPEAQKRGQSPSSRDGVVQWLRPTRNLRRAIVAATILGPPAQ